MQPSQHQFGRQAAFYAISRTHAEGESLSAIRQFAALTGGEAVLDVGTGAGFTAFALAPAAAFVIASDITREMLHQAQRLGSERGLNEKLRYVLANAEALPFADAAFDVVTCRIAAHHFHNIHAAVREWARVVRHGGKVIVNDTVSPEDEALAAYMGELEVRRDPSHVRNYPPSLWRQMLAEAGLRVQHEAVGRTPLEFHDWVRRSGTAPEQVKVLWHLFEAAGPLARETFAIRREGDTFYFSWENRSFLTSKEGT